MAFAMAFTMMAGAAYTDQDDIQATDAVELLATLNVMTGKGDGMFHPNDTITRAEICRIIYTIRNDGNSNADAYADMQTTFQDLTSADDWAKGYIKHCQSVNLISGRDEKGTTFGPQDPVTGVELAVICLRVLGYDPAKAGIGGESWSTKTVGLANEAGLLKNVNMESVTGPCERQWAAQIMANMLDAYTVRWSTDGDQYTTMGVDNTRNPKVGKEYMKLDSDIGLLTAIDKENIVINIKSVDAPDSFHGAGNQTFTKVPKDYSELLGQKVKVLFHNEKNNDVIGVYAVEGNTVYTVAANGVEKDNDERIKFGGNTYPVTRGGIDTYIDGVAVAKTTVDQIDNNNLNPNMYTLVDSDDDGRLDTLIVKTYNVAKVSYAASDRIIANGTTYRHADENIAEGIAKDDWVVITNNLYDGCYDIVKADMATGKLTGLRQETKAQKLYYDGKTEISNKTYNEYQIDSAWYFGGGNAPLQDTKLSQNDINSVQAGNNVEFVAVNNIMFYIKRVSGNANGRVDNAAMVIAKDSTGGASPRVKIAFFDGTTKAVEVKVDNSLTLAQLTPGVVYEFDKSGDQYKFYALKDQNKDTTDKYKNYYGDLSFNGTNAHENSYYTGIATSSKLESIGSYRIADDAQILLYAANDSKKITGKQFKTLAAARYSGSKYYAFHGDMDGLDRIGALAITVDDMDEVKFDSYSHYGYIVQDAYRITGTARISYTIWNGKENIVVEEASGDTDKRAKGTVIGYDSIKEENGVNVIDDVNKITNITFTAITKLNTNKTKAQFNDKPYSASSNELDIVADKVFYINSDADKYEDIGIVEGTLGVATKDNAGNWRANALVIGNGDEIELLIFDVGEYLDNSVYPVAANSVKGSNTTSSGSATTNGNALVTASNILVNEDGLLRGQITVERAEWMDSNAAVTVPYTIKDANGSPIATGISNFTVPGGDSTYSASSLQGSAKFAANENISITFGAATANNVKVRYFVEDKDGKRTPVTLTTANKTLSTTNKGEFAATPSELIVGLSGATADWKIEGVTIDGSAEKEKKDQSIVGKVVFIAADSSDTNTIKANGTGYVDVIFSNVTGTGVAPVIPENASPEEVKKAVDKAITDSSVEKPAVFTAENLTTMAKAEMSVPANKAVELPELTAANAPTKISGNGTVLLSAASNKVVAGADNPVALTNTLGTTVPSTDMKDASTADNKKADISVDTSNIPAVAAKNDTAKVSDFSSIALKPLLAHTGSTSMKFVHFTLPTSCQNKWIKQQWVLNNGVKNKLVVPMHESAGGTVEGDWTKSTLTTDVEFVIGVGNNVKELVIEVYNNEDYASANLEGTYTFTF